MRFSRSVLRRLIIIRISQLRQSNIVLLLSLIFLFPRSIPPPHPPLSSLHNMPPSLSSSSHIIPAIHYSIKRTNTAALTECVQFGRNHRFTVAAMKLCCYIILVNNDWNSRGRRSTTIHRVSFFSIVAIFFGRSFIFLCAVVHRGAREIHGWMESRETWLGNSQLLLMPPPPRAVVAVVLISVAYSAMYIYNDTSLYT